MQYFKSRDKLNETNLNKIKVNILHFLVSFTSILLELFKIKTHNIELVNQIKSLMETKQETAKIQKSKNDDDDDDILLLENDSATMANHITNAEAPKSRNIKPKESLLENTIGLNIKKVTFY